MQKAKSGFPARILGHHAISMQTKLIVIFLVVTIIPLFILCLLAWRQFAALGAGLQRIAVSDSTKALNDSAVTNIERMSTDAANRLADFLYSRDADVRYVATMEPTEENFSRFLNAMRGQVVKRGTWQLAAGGQSWASADGDVGDTKIAVSTNDQNNDMDGFHPVPATTFEYELAPLYDEMTFIGLDGREKIKVVAADSPKVHYPMDPALKDVSSRENTYVKAEGYFQTLQNLAPGEIYVSDVIGAYTGSNYVGMYVPDAVGKAAADRGYAIPYEPEEQAYAGAENPNGRRFEGIVRWATPVAGPDGKVSGYVTLALNHDHIMEFVDHLTPMDERYTALPSAFEGNYAFIWDYKCRSICHPRHHSIVGFDPETGDPAVPWLEESIYNAWQASGGTRWADFAQGVPVFNEQSRNKRPAPALTKAGLVGLDGRYLNNAPQCTGWMDLTRDGGSGSFYILWSGLYKLNTAAAIPYYTGQYAPSEANDFSRRGFGFVAIGSGMEYFTAPARATEDRLRHSIDAGLKSTVMQLVVTTAILTLVVVLVAVWMARHISLPIKLMAQHTSRLAIGDISTGGVPESAMARRDEIGRLAQALDDLTLASRDEVAMANAIAGGDYTRGIPLRSESDQIGKAFKAMLNVNKTTLSHVNRTVGRLGEGAEVVAGVSVSLSEGVETSQTVLREISDNVEEVNRQAGDNAHHAEDANKLAVSSWNSASRGYTSVSELAGAMAEIQTAGKRIESVVKLIDDIAFQTNLLALNAAVEAARAGRHGRGFSVVADEVRNLSQRSAKAAHETGSMVSSMLGLMAEGANLAEHSDKEFQEIVQTTEEMTRLSESISVASRAQSDSILRIMDRLGRIGGVTDANSKYAQQVAAYAGDLSSQAEALRNMVSLFRIEQAAMQGKAEMQNKALPHSAGAL